MKRIKINYNNEFKQEAVHLSYQGDSIKELAIELGIDVAIEVHNIINVDTGAAFTGKLTAMDIDTKEFWQSDPLPELYPDEKGRN